MVDLLIKGGLVYTMDSSRRVIEDGTIAIEGNSIFEVGKTSDLESKYSVARTIDAQGKAVLPGFVNVHTHLPSIFVRGVYGVVREGLYQVLFPSKEHLKPEHCYTLGLASCAEAITSGSTTIQETYNYMHHFAKAAKETGIRADLGEQIAEANYLAIKDGDYEYLPEQAQEMVKRAKKLKEQWDGKADGRITVSWAPLAPDMCTPWVYEEVMSHKQPGETVSTHVAQSLREMEQVKKLYGKTTVQHLEELGVLGPDLIGAHCIHCDDTDLRDLKVSGASILHCPRPYLLNGTTAPLAKWTEMGIKVGLGTDNVYHTMWETMRSALYGAQVRERLGEPVSPSYYEMLELATIRGAEVLGIAESVGSLEAGKRADIQLIDLYQPHILPTADITSSLVLYGATANVDTVIVDGNIVKENGKITTIDVMECLDEAQQVTQEIWENLFHEHPEIRRLVKR